MHQKNRKSEKKDDFIEDELWRATYPVGAFYIKYITPFLFFAFGYAIFSAYDRGAIKDFSNGIPFMIGVFHSFFHWLCFRDLKNKKMYNAGPAIAIYPGDSIMSAKFAIALAIFSHAMLALGMMAYYLNLNN